MSLQAVVSNINEVESEESKEKPTSENRKDQLKKDSPLERQKSKQTAAPTA